MTDRSIGPPYRSSDSSVVDNVQIRAATPTEAEAVIDVLDAALLAFDRDTVRAPDPTTIVLVADPGDRLIGAALVVADELVAVAVRPRWRRQGIGSALVSAAKARRDRLSISCREDLATFYARLGFDMHTAADGEMQGVWHSE